VREADEPFDQTYLDFLFESSPDALVAADSGGRVVRANEEFIKLFGFEAGELLERTIDSLIVPVDRTDEAAGLARRVAHGERVSLDTIRLRKDGTPVHVMVSAMPLRVRGELRGQYAIYRDLTERRQIQLDKQISDHRLRLVTENALDIITVLNGHGRIQYISPSVLRVLGYKPEERQGRTAFELIHLDDVVHVERAFLAILRESGPGQPIEFRHAHKDGTWRTLEGVPNNLLGDPAVGGIVITLRDVTDRKRAEEALRVSQERLAHEALHDGLTGLPNRAFFMERLDACIARGHRRKDDMFAVLFLDLDRFKVVNDSLGHLSGDLLLSAIARRLETCLRPGDSVARLGGDEFTNPAGAPRGRRRRHPRGRPRRALARGAVQPQRPRDLHRRQCRHRDEHHRLRGRRRLPA
jgi:PAS domain S-box-containing protein